MCNLSFNVYSRKSTYNKIIIIIIIIIIMNIMFIIKLHVQQTKRCYVRLHIQIW